MKKKQEKSQTRYSKNVKKKSKVCRLLQKIKPKKILDLSNIRLQLNLRSEQITEFDCVELQKSLKLEQYLDNPQTRISRNFQHYEWKLYIKKPDTFRSKLGTYQQHHPDMDIYFTDISRKTPIIKCVVYLITALGGIIAIIEVEPFSQILNLG